MSWLTPLGFLGLLGVIALIIIYIIKPNFQNKVISSTYIWKKSLKYKKKKIPISKLRNLLLFLCQLLALTAAALILAQPYIADEDGNKGEQTVLILDTSASMLTETAGITRFERAVGDINAYVDEAFENEKKVSIIVASDTSYFLAQNASVEAAVELKQSLMGLLDVENSPCTFGTPDIDGAIALAEEITASSLGAEVRLYTDTNYIDKGKVTVVDVSDAADWNAAVLDVRAKLVENQYVFEVDVACYGADTDIRVYCDFYGVNIDESTIEYDITARCSNDEVQTLVFSADAELADEVVNIYSYNYVHVYVKELDSLSYDNSFYLYGGKRPVLNVQYYSALPNNFFSSALMVLRDKLGTYWDLEIKEVKYDEVPETEGFDLYIFEHVMPSKIPDDGIVILANPDKLPSSSGIQLGGMMGSSDGSEIFLSPGDDHPIMKNISAERVSVSLFTQIKNYDDFIPLMYVDNYPVVMVKDEPDAKVVVMSFSMNYSNFALTPDFPIFMNNIINHFAPQTLNEFVFDANEKIELNARGEMLEVDGPDTSLELESFPAELTLRNTGVYTLTQELLSGDPAVENFFVKIPAEESDINHEVDTLKNPYFYQESDASNIDLVLYFAIALVSLLFIEWWLKSREQV